MVMVMVMGLTDVSIGIGPVSVLIHDATMMPSGGLKSVRTSLFLYFME